MPRLARPATAATAAVAAVAVLATACTSDGDDDAAVPTTADAAESERAATDGADLFSPTEVDAPFDLAGGAPSGTVDDVTVVDDGRADLPPTVAAVTEAWPTDWTRRTVDPGELAVGIPAEDPRDRIPPIDTPRFESVDAAAGWLDPAEPGALVTLGGEARFYPLAILTRHEVVNDRFGDVPVAVTYCPLCNTALSFDRRVDGEVLRFGVSGLLRLSDLVMWDDATGSLWQQITGEAIVGELAGTELVTVPTAIVSFAQFQEAHPDARSLSRDTGFGIPYGANPYVGYSSGDGPIPQFFDAEVDGRFPALERVVGVSEGGEEVAFPFPVLEAEQVVHDDVGGVPVVVWWVPGTLDALDAGRIADSRSVGTGIAFDRRVDGRVLTFEPSGDDRFTDVETGSEWDPTGLAVSGPLEGARLDLVTHRNELWFAWAGFFPDGRVVSG
jgi:hypothetical protein